ncbi:hypothetical protein GDO78_003873 [Eleutherodactylus coqui]|uniref:Uncharacterized protein n=1 Tax=Eleutherodactylus coqui TaxID=57060 RepID=A0A8J6EVJ2_ELECQ|nr:hypothetical protein GDO78_003873 [Eleutherodactylus coqui]
MFNIMILLQPSHLFLTILIINPSFRDSAISPQYRSIVNCSMRSLRRSPQQHCKLLNTGTAFVSRCILCGSFIFLVCVLYLIP